MDKTTAAVPVRERVQINADLLKNQTAFRDLPKEPPPGVDLKNLEAMAKGTPEDIIKDMGGKDIRFAPAMGENLQAAFTANKPSATDRPDTFDLPDSTTSADLSKAMTQLNKAALQNAASDKQLLLESGASLNPSEKDLLGKDVLGKLNQDALAGKGDSAKVPGFSSLDEVLGSGGGIGAGGPILMPTDLLFAYNSAVLAPGARTSMMKLGMIIQKNNGKHFVIEGHTDTFGGDPYNNDLSLRRAEAVKEWLVDTLKLDAGLISTEGHGKTRPIVNPHGTVEQQGMNRRVEIRTEH